MHNHRTRYKMLQPMPAGIVFVTPLSFYRKIHEQGRWLTPV